MEKELIAIPVFQDRISPLMDVSDKYALYEIIDGAVKQVNIMTISSDNESQRLEKLKSMGVNTIICGAVSGCIAHIVSDKGMKLFSMVYGPVEEIVAQYLNNKLPAATGYGRCGNKKGQGRGRCSGKKTAGKNSTVV